MNASLVEASGARVALRGAKTIVLGSYKRDGTLAATPVSLACEGERLFFRSYDRAWKTKRIRHNPRVELAPSTLRGKPTGEPVSARAVLLEGEDATAAARALARRHRVLQGCWFRPRIGWRAIRQCITSYTSTQEMRGWDDLLA
jgi:PPOX class probable F420-dependent enzyme